MPGPGKVQKIIYMEDAPKQLQISYLEMIKTILQNSEEQRQQEQPDGQDGISESDNDTTE